MIGQLRGTLVLKRPPELLLDVGGVGYEVQAPMSTFYDLPEVGQQVTLLTHLQVREDDMTLYGFIHNQERQLFRALLKISGVGAKLALAILSGMETSHFVSCIERQDHQALTRIPGIGRKTAERLVIEMRDRLGILDGADVTIIPNTQPRIASDPHEQEVADAINALIALGYKPNDAPRMVKAVDDVSRSSQDMIRLALRNASVG